MKKVLVTGDRGYIGSTLVPMLIDSGYDVRGIDTEFFKQTIGKTRNKKYEKISKDIRHVTSEDLKGINAIIHLSALSNDPMGSIAPKLTEEINYKASVRLAKLAKKLGVKRFLFSSSCSIYGIGKEDTVTENSKVNPLTEYAKSKIKTERALKKLADKNFTVGLLRNSTVYGFSLRFRNDLVVNNFVTYALATKKIEVTSDGTPWRPLIDVRDLCRIFIEFLQVEPDKINGQVINIGFNENNFQVKDVLSIVKKSIPKCSVVFIGAHAKDSRSYKVNFNKFHTIFPHIKQKWRMEKSVRQMISQLHKYGFGKVDFYNGTYTRLDVLKNLIETGKVTKDLYWTA